MSSPVLIETCPPHIGSRVFAYYFGKCVGEHFLLFARQRDSRLVGKVKSGEMPVRDQDVLEAERMNGTDKNVPALVNSQTLQATLKFTRALRVIRDACHAPRWLHIFSQHPGPLYRQGLGFGAFRTTLST